MPKEIARALTGVLLLLSLSLLTACAFPVAPQEPFRTAASDYVQRLRWHDYHGVARHLAEENRKDFLESFLPLSDLRITDVRLDHVDVRARDRKVTHIVLEYYLLPSTTVKTVALRQEWIYDRPHGWQALTAIPPLN